MNEASAVVSKACPACGNTYPGDGLYCPNDGAPLKAVAHTLKVGGQALAAPVVEVDPYLGLELAGHIVVRELVGVGAMGRVYRAFQKGIDRDVAVKILHRELSANAQLVARFTREAKVASRLTHPNVVQVLLAGQLDDGALYIVMEYLDGLSLQSALAACTGPMPLSRALHIGLQLCDAVGEAHQQGIVHRDLKPENVMLVRRGVDEDFVKVLDFGIARVNWGEQSMATAAGLIFGTARYISPEGAQGAAVGPASDVYGIATLFYQLLSGKTPFDGDQAVGLLVQQIHDPPPPLLSLAGTGRVPAPIADVIMANLAKSASAREPDARAFGRAIIGAARRAGLAAEDISRPILQGKPSPLQLPPSDRAKQFELTPELLARMGPGPATPPRERDDDDGSAPDVAARGKRAAIPARHAPTTKWEPPISFQADLNALAERALASRASEPALEPAAIRGPGGSPVEITLDDAAAQPAPERRDRPTFVTTARSPEHPEPVGPRVRVSTRYASPWRPDDAPRDGGGPGTRASAVAPPMTSRSKRSVLVLTGCVLVALLLGVGATLATRSKDDAAEKAMISRATEAMFGGRFVEPPGDNVRDLTSEGLRRWPNDPGLLDVRARAVRGLVGQATTKHAEGEGAEALRLLQDARELAPDDAAVARLFEQYQGELSTLSAGQVLSPAPLIVPAAEPPEPVVAPPVAKVPSPSRPGAHHAHKAPPSPAKVEPEHTESRPDDPPPAPAPSVKWM